MLVRRARAVLSVLAASAAIMAIPTTSAHALTYTWNCNYGIPAYSGCYSGSFHSWVSVAAAFGSISGGSYGGMCVKGVTEAGTVKGGAQCWDASVTLAGITMAPTPTSEGYFYFGGSGVSYSNSGTEGT
jgi:hypothetical protein